MPLPLDGGRLGRVSNRPSPVDRCPRCNAKLEVRSLEANSKLHAVIHDIAEQKEWAGKKLDAESWKRLLVAAWCRANGQGADVVPAVDGHGFDVIYRRTSRMNKQELSELLEYIQAWAVDNGVELQEQAA